jgi:hypothetical protein
MLVRQQYVGGTHNVGQKMGPTVSYPWRTRPNSPGIVDSGPHQLAPKVGPESYP